MQRPLQKRKAEEITPSEQMAVLRKIRMDIQNHSGLQLAKYQCEASDKILQAHVDGGGEVCMLWARRSGKTETLTQTGLTLGIYEILFLERDFRLGLVNPAKNNQSVMVTRNRLRTQILTINPWLRNLGITQRLGRGRKTNELILHQKSTNAEFLIQAISADPSAEEKGAGFNVMFLEQPEDIDEQTMKTIIFPMATGKELRLTKVLAGTPALSIKNNYFYEHTRHLQYPLLIDCQIAARERPDYMNLAKIALQDLGNESDEYKTQYQCEWVQIRNRLIDRDQLIRLAEDYTPDPTRFRAAGIDVAKEVDRTVVTIAERNGNQIHLTAWLELEGVDYETQAAKIIQTLTDWKVKTVVIDKGGPGNVIIDMIKPGNSNTHIIPFTFTPQSIDELYTNYKRELDQSRLHYPKQPLGDQVRLVNHFIEEHLDVVREAVNNLIRVHAPNRRGAHDDYVASGALAVHGILKGDNAGVFTVIGVHRRK